MGRFSTALKHMFNAFSTEQEVTTRFVNTGASYGTQSRPYAARVRMSNERTIISSIYSRIAVDIGAAEFRHVRTDDNGQYKEDVQSSFNDCLATNPNIDQGPSAFLRDYALTLMDRGVAAIVPVDTTTDPRVSGSWDINSMRVGTITAWFPRMVTIRLYNDQADKGIFEEITLPKTQVAIVENPFYAVMNEPNSTMQRLQRKLALLDSADEASASGKMDMIIQLPYVIKSEARRQQAEQRRKDIEFQLRGSEYGIAYTDGTEKITQLNRPMTNNLLEQIEYLENRAYDQLGITKEIQNGSADEKTMLNYNVRTVKPFLDALQEEYIRKFLTKTARTQGQTVMFFKNPFELMPLSELAEVGDVLSRNEIVAPNELRTAIGMKPHPDPAANQLANSNMVAGTTPGTSNMGGLPNPNGSPAPDAGAPPASDDEANAALDQVDKAIDDAFAEFGVGEDDGTDEQAG